nr:hypothetical protein [Bradyrhizobium tropiciagri]
MHQASWMPAALPGTDQAVYLVVDDFGPTGRAWREVHLETTDLETVIHAMLSGEYHDPIRVVAFNTTERWSEDVSEDVARELQRRWDLQLIDVQSGVQGLRRSTHRRPAPVHPAAGLSALKAAFDHDELGPRS